MVGMLNCCFLTANVLIGGQTIGSLGIGAIITAGMGGISSYGLILTGDLARDLELRQLQISFYGLGVAMIPQQFS